MFPKVIKAAAGPHNLGSGNDYDETLPKLTVEWRSDSDAGSEGTGDFMTDHSSSLEPFDKVSSKLEPFNNASSVRPFLPPGCQFLPL